MDQQSLIAMAFKMTVSLGVVLLIFGGALYLVRRFSGASRSFLKKGGKNSSAKPMEVLAFQSLGPGRSLYLVRCLGQKVLVGATAQSINQICEIKENDDQDEFDSQDETFTGLVKKASSDEASTSRLKSEHREVSRV